MLDDSYFDELKKELISGCKLCLGSGYFHGETCSCIIEFRARHRLILGNFSDHLLKIELDSAIKSFEISNETKSFLNFFLENPNKVKENGLSLYIWSESRGVGKTTLAHILAKEFACYYALEKNYSRSNNYRFMEIGEFFDLCKKGNYQTYGDFIKNWDATLFVLDDFGNEDRSAKWDFDFVVKKMQEFLRHRTRLRLPTIITTNVRPSTLSPTYLEDVSSLLEVQPDGSLGGILWRELFVKGHDFRLEKGLSSWKE